MPRIHGLWHGEANSLGGLGNSYHFLGQYERAIEYHQQYLTIAREIKDRQGESVSLGNLGSDYHSLGQYERAIEYHQQHLTIAREIKDRQGEANSLNSLGLAHQELGQTKEAIQAFQASLTIATPETMPDSCIAAGNNLGKTHCTQGNWELAITGYQPAIEAIELTHNSSLTDDRCKQILENYLGVYDKTVQCYIKLEQYEKALEYADRSRSRFLADLFHNKDLHSKGDISPQVQEYLDLQQQIDGLRFVSPSDGMMGERLSTIASPEAKREKIRQLGATKQQILENIRRENPELAAQLQPTPLSFQKIQRLIPDRKTALLNFYSTNEDTFIFILRYPNTGERSVACYICKGEGYKNLQKWIWQTWLNSYINIKNSKFIVIAPLLNCKPEDIETIETTNTAALVTLTDGSQKTINISQEFLKQTRKKRDQLQKEWQNQMEPTLAELSQRLQLQQLIDNHLQDIEELIIVPHLNLHQIPFAALPISPKVAENPETTAPVLQTAGQTRDYRNIAGIDDTSDTKPTPPKYIDNNEYLSDRFRIRVVPSCQILDFCHQREAIATKTVGIVENTTGDLHFTPEECRKLAELYKVPPERHLKEEKATIANYLKLAQQVNVLHSSHHASSNLSNALESGLRLSDGTLDLANLYIQSFPQLSEVFLSCCETNFTLSEITDDVLTLAGGFLTAGARSVVSTLWSVQDDSTAEFCELYYQFRNQGETSPEALRKAQFELRKIPRFNHPYYWAAFVSQG
ncbi:MAG: CHAT domain-containing protein [Okeania sp. SIO3I5]|uniref:CHAT domain-containing protein n=1 Tax=Okeania sp. SIO3I5 TaxID=2607805 RepID=UPI0013B7C371|nr:CHAT domain-containing tetratricopeptide repeat protein [Okeania sp. SIO3I5]NEQ36525.1 CHAT domain-containing protein [Okeania sp. SIO3I5]